VGEVHKFTQPEQRIPRYRKLLGSARRAYDGRDG
jgi:hypothetical protein